MIFSYGDEHKYLMKLQLNDTIKQYHQTIFYNFMIAPVHKKDN